jgi:hypothetical protein
MRILLDCEESQTCCIEFRKLGHEAYSCDLLPCSGGHPEWHLQMDAFEAIKLGWDLIIAFPPCTHLAVSGAKHFTIKRADGRQESAIRFFFELWKLADCLENPIGILNGGNYIKQWFPELYKEMISAGFTFASSQTIQPWQFGDEAQKSTCLWLKNLPLLYHNSKPNLFDTVVTHVDKGEFYTSPNGKVLPKWYGDAVGKDGKKLSYSGDEIKKVRSKTFPGIAGAMATQWTEYLLK